jgi:hypothetical protein
MVNGMVNGIVKFIAHTGMACTPPDANSLTVMCVGTGSDPRPSTLRV